MLAIVQKDWSSLAPDRQIAMLKKLKPDMLCAFVRKLDATRTDICVLRWIAAQQEIDLGTALTLFLSPDPRRWNLLPRNAFPEDVREICAVLDVLCQRINCGFYLPIAARQMADTTQVSTWLKRQADDIEAGRRGRWVFDTKILAPLVSDYKVKGVLPKRSPGQRPGLIQGLFTPMFVAHRT